MPRAHRIHIPGMVWHITHRCHKQEFLLKFSKDRQSWINWLFEAKKRYQVKILNYIVTSNHIHLLMLDEPAGSMSKSIQLIAGRTAQEYNMRKKRKGAFWEDRYHATAIETGVYLQRCLTYIDLNMVRAGVVKHPSDWENCGYHELQDPPLRYRIIDRQLLFDLLRVSSDLEFKKSHNAWIKNAIERNEDEKHFSSSVAVGSNEFVKQVMKKSGISFNHRKKDYESEKLDFHYLKEKKKDTGKNKLYS